MTGQILSFFLHDSSGKSLKEKKSRRTARAWFSGNCTNGGHSVGEGIGHSSAIFVVSKVKGTGPDLQSFVAPSAISTSPTKYWRRAKSKQKKPGIKMSAMLAHILRFYMKIKYIDLQPHACFLKRTCNSLNKLIIYS